MEVFSDKMYWQVTSFPRMRSPNSISFIMGDLVGKRSILKNCHHRDGRGGVEEIRYIRSRGDPRGGAVYSIGRRNAT